ncbi:hypothetical protein DFH09DRAFT_1308859 [Mycena vulgaris]|nr:hypothetical protein DFH09DRAFT_1308859 [Mycena vulgaris]
MYALESVLSYMQDAELAYTASEPSYVLESEPSCTSEPYPPSESSLSRTLVESLRSFSFTPRRHRFLKSSLCGTYCVPHHPPAGGEPALEPAVSTCIALVVGPISTMTEAPGRSVAASHSPPREARRHLARSVPESNAEESEWTPRTEARVPLAREQADVPLVPGGRRGRRHTSCQGLLPIDNALVRLDTLKHQLPTSVASDPSSNRISQPSHLLASESPSPCAKNARHGWRVLDATDSEVWAACGRADVVNKDRVKIKLTLAASRRRRASPTMDRNDAFEPGSLLHQDTSCI